MEGRSMKSRAAIFVEAGKPMVLDEVEMGDPAPGDVLIKLSGTGICHSDLHYFRGYRPPGPPRLLGHEGTGEVIAVGAGVTHLKEGDRVVTAALPRNGPMSETDRPRSN